MRILSAHFASGDEFLHDYAAAAPEFDGPALHVRTRTELALGERVLVEVSLPKLPNRERLLGEVAGPGPGGLGVWVVLSPDDRLTLDYLIAHARRFGGTAIARAHERFPVAVPCDWQVAGGDTRVLSTTEDLSAGGAFVRAFAPPAIGTRVVVELPGAAGQTLRLAGEVVWVRQDLEQPGRGGGMGIRFAAPHPEAAASTRRLREMLRHAAERGRIQLS